MADIDARVNGGSAVYAVIGDPVAHSFSPYIHNTIAARLGDNLIYEALHVLPEDIGAAVKGAYALGIGGLNVTIPHKSAVIPHLCAVDEAAHQAGAVNTLKYTAAGYVGYNTDIFGIINALRNNDIEPRDKDVLILGAGGTAKAAAIAMGISHVKSITIANRTVEKADQLVAQIGKFYGTSICSCSISDVNADYDIVIQTTSAGFGKQAGISPVDAGFWRHVGAVLDVVYTPWETQLLKDARAAGVQAVNGFEMLVFQAVKSYEIWQEKQLEEAFVKQLISDLKIYFLNNN